MGMYRTRFVYLLRAGVVFVEREVAAVREIKFRAWDNDNKRMSQPFSIGCKRVWFGRFDIESDYVAVSPDLYQVMQYTGLKDRNGVEIYEGDIVRFNGFYDGGESDFIAEIEFKFNRYVGWFLHKDYEVIGNIYEHSELLEK